MHYRDYRVGMLVALLVFLFPIGTGAQGSCYNYAQAYYELKDYERSLELIECAKEEAPNSAAVYFLSARIGSAFGSDQAEIMADYTQAVELEPNNSEYLFQLAVWQEIEGQYEVSLVNLNRAFDLGYTNDIWFYFRRARAYRGVGDFDASLADFETFINGNPANIYGFVNRGQTYREMGNWEQAIADISHGTAFEDRTWPGLPGLYLRRAQVYSDTRDFRAAELDLREAISLSNDTEEIAELQAELAHNYLLWGQLDEALEAAEEAVTTDAANPDGYNVLGRVQLQLGNIEASTEAATSGDDALVQGQVSIAAGEYDAALEVLSGAAGTRASLLQSLAHNLNHDPEAAQAAFDGLTANLTATTVDLLPTGAVDVEINNSTAHTVAFSGQAGDVVIVTANTIDGLHSNPFLALLGPDGVPIAFDDDGGYATNAALNEFTLPEDGTYTVFVSGDDFRTGAVSIAVTGNNMPGNLDANACSTLVQTAYTITADACSATGSDEMCYGNALLEIAPQSSAFTASGDLIAVADVESVALSGMNQQINEWGISLMRVTAQSETGSLEDVDLVLFGNVDLQNAGTSAAIAEPNVLTVTAANTINVRGGPSTNEAVVGSLPAGQSVESAGSNAVGDWLAITLADGTPGWVYAPLVTIDGDMSALPIAGEEIVADEGAGTRAFTFTSGASDRPCEKAPDSGILIQTPQGVGEVSLLVNEVVIDLGSTAYVQAVPGRYLTIYMLEGFGEITHDGVTVQIPAGLAGRVQLNETGMASTIPEGPFDFEPFEVSGIPLGLLANTITVAATPTPTEVAEALSLPVNGTWALNWDLSRVDCADFIDTTYDFAVLDNGALISMGDIYLTRSGPNTYRSGLVSEGIVGGGGGSDGSFSLWGGKEYTLTLTSPTEIRGEVVRWSYEDILTMDQFDTMGSIPCERIENSFSLSLAE